MSGHVGVPSVQLKSVSQMFRFISRVLHSRRFIAIFRGSCCFDFIIIAKLFQESVELLSLLKS